MNSQLKKRFNALTVIACLSAGSSSALADGPTTAPSAAVRPAYTVLRWNEDYSFLKNPPAQADFFDPIKYIPLNSTGDSYLSLGGEFAERYEDFNNLSFGAGPEDNDGFELSRFFLNADAHFGPDLRAFVEVKGAYIDQRTGGARPTDADAFDFDQAFGDFKLPIGEKDSLTFRGGRQYLLYGLQRLISPLDWVNTRRTFDGFKLSLATPELGNTLDAFVTKPVPIDNAHINSGDDHQMFWGVYDTLMLPGVFGAPARTDLETYFLGLDQSKRAGVGAFPAIAVGSDTYTVGARFYTNPKPWDLDIEADDQFGRADSSKGNGDISAYSLAIDTGYTFQSAPTTPRFNVGFDIASGDRDSTNPDKQTFNQLFPLGHAFFGYIDVVGRQNIIDLHPGLTFTLLKQQQYVKLLTLKADYHVFWRESLNDSLYNAAGGIQRAAGGSHARNVGDELDLLLNWQIDQHLSTYLGYSHFWTGNFIQSTGVHRDIDFLYAAVNYVF